MIREKYISESSYLADVESLIQDIGKFRQLQLSDFDVSSSALLVLDMQNYFLSESSHAFIPSSISLLPRINKLATSFISRGQPVIFTRHINSPENAGNMKIWWRELITEDHELSGISRELDTGHAEIINKTQYDAFYLSSLKEYLDTKEVKNLVITGVMTHLCCETTARSAFVQGYNVIFPIDGTATYNRGLHLGSLKSLAHGLAKLCTMDNIIQMVNDGI